MNLPSAGTYFNQSAENEMRRIVERAINDLQALAVKNPATGWGIPTGTPLITAFDTATVTLPQLAGHVMALTELMRQLGYIRT